MIAARLWMAARPPFSPGIAENITPDFVRYHAVVYGGGGPSPYVAVRCGDGETVLPAVSEGLECVVQAEEEFLGLDNVSWESGRS